MITTDPTEIAQHHEHLAVQAFEREAMSTDNLNRLHQLRERAGVLRDFWSDTEELIRMRLESLTRGK